MLRHSLNLHVLDSWQQLLAIATHIEILPAKCRLTANSTISQLFMILSLSFEAAPFAPFAIYEARPHNMANTSPEAASHGLLAGKGLLSETKTHHKRRADKNARVAARIRRRRSRKSWTPRSELQESILFSVFSYTETTLLTVIDHQLHKLSNIQKTVRLRSPEGGFQRIVHDIADEIKPGIRFQSRAFAALQEALKSFTTSYFTGKPLINIIM